MERLLAAGHTVQATVRDPSKEDALKALKALDGASDRLKFFAADLEVKGSFAAAVTGCSCVMHTASPFFTPKRQADVVPKLLNPAVNGTENLLGAAPRLVAKRSLQKRYFVLVAEKIVILVAERSLQNRSLDSLQNRLLDWLQNERCRNNR